MFFQICHIFLISFPVLSKVVLVLADIYRPKRNYIHPGLAVLSGPWGLVVLLLSKFCIMILPYFLSFYFLVVILSGDRQPVLVPVLVQLLVAVLVVEDSTLLK